MGLLQYDEAHELIKNHPEIIDALGPRSESLIVYVENHLNIKFPSVYKKFLLEFGTASIGSSEIYGLINENFDDSSVPDAAWYTLEMRKKAGLPDYLFVISELGDGEIWCLDTRDNEDGAILAFQPGLAIENQVFEILWPSFSDFFLRLLKEELK